MQLVESNTRGCRPTEAGRALAELANPLVTGISSLKQTLQEGRLQTPSCLTIAATQRFLVEDLPGCLVEFERRCPSVRLDLKEVGADRVAAAIYRNDLLEEIITSLPADEIFKRAQAVGLAWSPIRRPEENLNDPHFAARGS